MSLTDAQKLEAIAALDDNITKTPNKVSGKFVTLEREDGVYTVKMIEYETARGEVGYVRMVECADPLDSDLIHVFRDHQGPETRRDSLNGWTEYRLDGA